VTRRREKETIMRDTHLRSMITVAIAAAAVGAVISISVTQTSGQAQLARPASVGGKPNFSGIWQANNEANWDLQAHAARPGVVTQPGVYPYGHLELFAGLAF
jgi:hypothetical protein